MFKTAGRRADETTKDTTMSKISTTDQATLLKIQTDMQSVATQASANQSVTGDDSRLSNALTQLQTMKNTYSSDPTNNAEIARMIGDVQNLQGIAGSTVQNTSATNASWTSEMSDLTSMITSYTTNGDSSTATAASLGTAVTDTSTLPSGSDATSASGTLYDLHTTPKTYVSADDTAQQYTVYDATGTKTQSFSYADASKYGVDMGDGQSVALSTSGFASSWLMNGDGGRQLVNTAATSSTSSTQTSSSTADGSLAGAGNGPGPGTAYKNMPSTATALPGDLATLQQTQQVNYLGDAKPPVYVTSDNASPINYTVYAADGTTKLESNLQAPFAIGLNNGSWYAASSKGVASAWTTTDAKSLSSDTHLYDLNGATSTALADSGLNSDGVATSTAVVGNSLKDRTDTSNWTNATQGYKYWAGAKGTDGTVYANVSSPSESGKGKTHYTKLVDADNKDVTPSELDRGQYGTFSYTNGSQYVSLDASKLSADGKNYSGYFMVTGDTATDVITGETMPADQLTSAAASQNLTAYTQADQEAKSTAKTSTASSTSDSAEEKASEHLHV